MTFEPFPKIARLNRDCVITEKIDGTNAQIWIRPMEELSAEEAAGQLYIETTGGALMAGSRNRWIKPGDDNYGFAAWAWEHAEELAKLGPGRHFGEWWGKGIQRGYGINEKRFSLFNVHRWEDPASRPACVGVVPVLFRDLFRTIDVEACLEDLSLHGSKAAPGFMKPEGIIIYHTAQQSLFKVTLEDDDVPKALAKKAA